MPHLRIYTNMKKPPNKNNLDASRSPYLLQHQNNPVHWQPWNDDVIKLAQKLDKPLLISIGYAACHWCHVMAHETFENETAARIMNDHFISVKVDREERPDIDAVYMQAVQMMTGGGGWPLHIFALPDGRPFFGGTYYPREQWQQICRAASHEFIHNREKLVAFARDLEKGLQVRVPVINPQTKTTFSKKAVESAVASLKLRFDTIHGGLRGAPKFPMPALLNFLHDFSLIAARDDVNQFVRNTLTHVSMGGIYDHIGGGFARYSVDSRWRVPHFEKMLYDNAQLLALLSKAHRANPSPLFNQRLMETSEFILRDLQTDMGLFASSLDADSEGVEGAYYVWKQDELKEILGDLFKTAQAVFSINEYGFWENDKYILQQQKDVDQLADDLNIADNALEHNINAIKTKLFHHRSKRTPPHCDRKVLTSWNGLAIEGLTLAAAALDSDKLLKTAQHAADILMQRLRMTDGGLFHVYANGTAYISGLLGDYSAIIRALITLYQHNMNQNNLTQARKLMEYVFDHFANPETGFFYTTPDYQPQLIKRDIVLTDGVIPSANSQIAHDLLDLARYFNIPAWQNHAKKMVINMADEIEKHPISYGHWASLYLSYAYSFSEVTIAGQKARQYMKKFMHSYHPGVLFAGSQKESTLPILSERYQATKTLIYICRNQTCEKPLESIEKAINTLN